MNTTKIKATTVANRASHTKDFVMTGMFTAVLCVVAPLTIPIGPVPISMVIFAIFLTGAILPPLSAFWAAIVYIFMGAIGLPVFSGFRGGFHVLSGPTGGFIMAYPIMTLLTALIYKSSKKKKMPTLTVGMLVSLVLCYTMGTLWFSFNTDTEIIQALFVCVLPFLVFDIIKIGLAVLISSILKKVICIYDK